MPVENAAAAAQTIFNLFFLSRSVVVIVAAAVLLLFLLLSPNIYRRHTYAPLAPARRLSWGFLWPPLPSPSLLALLALLACCCRFLLPAAATPCPLRWWQSVHLCTLILGTGHCWPVCLHAFSHLGISLAFCSFFERSFSAATEANGGVDVFERYRYIFLYILFFIRARMQ